MSADLYAHWVTGGDPAAARKYGLTLKAKCGVVFNVAKRMRLADKPPCAKCEEVGGPIPGAKGNEAVGASGRNALPHYVYRCYDAADRLLYVGCSIDVKTRRIAHSTNSWWFAKADHWRVTIYPNKLHALRVESQAIRTEMPLCNVKGQDFSAWDETQIELARSLAVELSASDYVARLDRVVGGAR